jgi:hypothetical protein
MASTQLPQRRAGRLLAVLAALAGTAALTAAPAAADAGSGTATLTFAKQSKATSLSAQGVKVLSVDAKGGSTVKTGTQVVELPLAELTIAGNGAKALTASKLKFSLGKKKALFGDVVFDVAGDSTSVSAKLGKRQLVLFRAAGAATIDASSVKLDQAALRLTGNAARAIKARLGLGVLASGKVGSLGLESKLTAPLAKPATPEPKKVDPPKTDPYPYASECPVPSVEGSGAFGTPPGKVSGIAPAPTFSPGVSQDVLGTSIDWGFRTSFREYVIFAPPAGSLQTLDGAGASAAGAGMAAPTAFFDFPVGGGKYEPGSEPDHSDDKLFADGAGTVLFCKPGHGFNVVLKNPTVTIDGDDSRITADIGVNANGTWYEFQRVDIADLDLSSVEPTIADGGNTLVWEDIPAKLTADGVLATGLSIYNAGEPLDPITVKTSLNRPLLAECNIDASTAAPEPVVAFGLADLPTLTDPVTGSGGTIDWGFRRGTRNTITSFGVPAGGGFQLLGGATEGYPGNMGGGATEAPSGGLEKFFRFPISEYAYDEGASGDPADDILIATSQATVGFCNPAAGQSYGVVLSKPTLIVNGASSRLVANAYSYQAGKGWAGGRVDLVNLNATGVNPVAGSGTLSWGDVPADNSPLKVGVPVTGAISTNALALANLIPAATGTGWDPVSAQIVLPAP